MASKSEFVIMEHEAKRAGKHYDLRFKMPNSNNWASFAVRKGVPTKTGTKVLAVRTHDHSRKEALFTGEIKSGYGAGKLKRWDGGSCIIKKYSNAHMAVEFKGSKVKGLYHLVNTGVMDKDFKGQKYMLFKGKE
jgi:DNA ligase D-like protein (predicted 3'-phosphoesterase)